MIEKFIEDQLRQLRKDTSTAPIEFRVETYVSQGMSESDAIIYIDCLKTQELLRLKLKNTQSKNSHDGIRQ